MLARLRPFGWPIFLFTLAVALYIAKIQDEMVDFDVYRTAGARSVNGEPLYRESDGHYQYKYFPAFALTMTPFAAVDRETAKAVWFGLSFGLLTVFMRWSVRAVPAREKSERALLWFAFLLMAKFYAHELTLGQTNILLGALLVGAMMAAQLESPLVAGVLVALGVFVKPYALVLVPWLFVSQGFRAIAACTLVIGAGLVFPAAFYGWRGNISLMADWYRTVTDTTAPNLLIAENVSFATMWAKWIGPGVLASRLAFVTMLASGAVVAWTWLMRKRVSEPDYLEFGQLMLLVPLISPQGWDYVLLLATPAVVLLVDRMPQLPAWQRSVTILAFALMSFTIYDLLGRSLYLWFMSINIVSVAALTLAVMLALVRRRGLA